MIPAEFEYYRPKEMSGVLSLLKEHGDEAAVIAGGHSLIPLMKVRMTDFHYLIDLQDLDGLDMIEIEPNRIRIGAMVTQHAIINHDELFQFAPILREAALQISDPQVRYMGTIGGNVANGDPANDMPGLMQCLDATFTLVGCEGERNISARDFYEAAYSTAREDDEVLTYISIPKPVGGYAYEKQKRKIGDYATAAAAVLISKERDVCTSASVAMTNLSDTPIYATGSGAALVGTTLDDAAIEASINAMLGVIDPSEDNRGPVAFKRHVAGIILRRAIERAWSRA